MRRLAPLAVLVLSLGLLAACISDRPSVGAPSPETAVSTPPASPAAAPAVTPQASPTPSTALPAPASTLEPLAEWKLYEDTGYGFEFRHPPACPVVMPQDSLYVGGQIELAIDGARGLDLQEYVGRFVDQRTQAGGWRLESQRMETVGENRGIRIEYRFGGTGRYGTALFLERKGRIYIWGLTAGGFTCDEPDVYGDIVASFRFIE